MADDRGDVDAPLERSVRRGSLWLGGNSLVMRVTNIAVMAVVARIVSPDDFGVFALAVVAHSIIVSFAELGVGSAIARRDLDEDAIAPTGVTISVGVGLILGALLAAFADPIAQLLGSEQAAPALRILAISVALGGVFAVPSAQLQRNFRQDVIFRANVAGAVIGAAVLIWLATVGDGAQAFAWSRVVGQLITGALLIAGLPKRYLPGWRSTSVTLLVRFGIPLALANLLSQIVVNVDYVFVGHALSVRDVGLYTLAFNIASWSSSVIGSVLNGIVLPAFSAVRERGGDSTGAYRTAAQVVALVSFPIAALTSGLAYPLVVTVYGPTWADAAPAVAILAVFGAVSAIALLLANILIAAGRTVILFVVQVAVLIGLVPALWLGIAGFGIIGAALAHVATVLLLTLPVYLFSLRRAIGARLSTFIGAVAWPLSAAVVAGSAAFAVSLLFEPPWLRLLVGGMAGGCLYLALCARLLLPLLPDGVRQRLHRGGARRPDVDVDGGR